MMLDFRFLLPEAFYLLLPLGGMLLWWLTRRGQIASAVLRYSDTRLLSGLPVGLRVRLRRIPDVLRLLAWVLIVVALARPQVGTDSGAVVGEGVNLVLALDISDSMAIADFNALTRLQAAKSVMRDFIAGREFDRIGLVIFAEEAFYQSPPTLDYDTLIEMLEAAPLATELGLSNRTALGMGIASATNMLRDSTHGERAIILLTDGANNAGQIDPISASQAAAAFDIRIYTIGIGSLISDFDELDEATLREIATITDGRYFNALSLADLQSIYERIDALERATTLRQQTILWDEVAHIVLFGALVLLMIERYLRHTLFQTIP